jgi:anaerobic dimethyl sulfoxide reductase subunit B (iron-sulfur subunit)
MRVACVEKGVYPEPFVAFLVMPCYHCAKPACISACPADAVTKRQSDGIVVVERERCLGKASCQACLEACPYGAPQFRLEDDAKMEKCDLCLDRLAQGKKPICVEACPMRALDAGPMEELRDRYGGGRVAEGFSWHEGVAPSVIFKGKVDERGSAVRSIELVPRLTC